VCCALDATGTPLGLAVWLDDGVVGSHCGGLTGVDRGRGPEGSERVSLQERRARRRGKNVVDFPDEGLKAPSSKLYTVH
jgi:hypothetical protein